MNMNQGGGCSKLRKSVKITKKTIVRATVVQGLRNSQRQPWKISAHVGNIFTMNAMTISKEESVGIIIKDLK